MFRVKTIDMRAHRKLRQKTCAHTKQKHKHMARKTKSPAMCKTGHEHTANENTQWQTQAAYHTEQDITWMHTANKNTNCIQQHSRTEESTWPNELETAHSHNKTEHGARVSEPCHETGTHDMRAGIRKPHSNTKQSMQMGERTARAHSI